MTQGETAWQQEYGDTHILWSLYNICNNIVLLLTARL